MFFSFFEPPCGAYLACPDRTPLVYIIYYIIILFVAFFRRLEFMVIFVRRFTDMCVCVAMSRVYIIDQYERKLLINELELFCPSCDKSKAVTIRQRYEIDRVVCSGFFGIIFTRSVITVATKTRKMAK